VLTAEELARAAGGEIVVNRAITGVGEHGRLLARPMPSPANGDVVGVVATSTATLTEARQRLTVVLGVAGPVLAAAIGAAAWFLTGAALRPVRRMTTTAATIAHERAFIDDAAHELRSPLAVLRGEPELTALDPSDAEMVADALASALEESARRDPTRRSPSRARARKDRGSAPPTAA
jgi:signal transduction histidine kinase